MTVETSESHGVCEGSEAEFLASHVDPTKAGGQCNDIACGDGEADGVEVNGGVVCGEEANGDAKDDGDGSYVFVNGETDELAETDLDVDGKLDPAESSGIESGAAEDVVSPSAGSEIEKKLAGYEDLSSQMSEAGELVLENVGDCEESGVSNSNSEVLGHKNMNMKDASDAAEEQSVPEPAVVMEANEKSNETKDESGDLCTANDHDSQGKNEEAAVDGLVVEQTGTESAANSTVEEQTDGESAVETSVEMEKIEESEIMATECVGSESLALDNEKEMGISNAVNGISTEEPSADLSMDSEFKSETGSVMDAGEGSIECSKKVPLCTVDNMELKDEANNGLLETRENTPTCPAEALESETTATYDHAESEESFSTSSVIDKGLVKEISISVDDGQLQPEAANGSAASEEKLSAHPAADDMDPETKAEKVSVEGGGPASFCLTSDPELESEVTNLSCENQKIVSVCPVVETKLVESVESASACLDNVTKPETEAINISVKTDKDVTTDHVDEVKVESEVETESVEHGESTAGSIRDDHSANRDDGDKVVGTEDDVMEGVHENGVLPSPPEDPGSLLLQGQTVDTDVKRLPSFCLTSDPELESEVTNLSCANQKIVSVCPVVETKLVESVESVSACLDNVTEPETEAINISVKTDKDVTTDHVDEVKVESEVETESVEHGESTAGSIGDDHSANRDDGDKVVGTEDDVMEGVHENGVLPSLPEDPGSLLLQGQKVDTDVKRLPCFMVRIPRFSNDKLKAQIQLAQQQVDEKTQSRDSIRVRIQKQKAICTEYREKLEAARKEEREARDAISAKRQEMDSIQLTLNKIKNATSIGEIDDRIHNLQHRMQHETIPLKEEKQLIREINQLRQNRDHLSSNMASQEELQKAFEQREQMENHFKHLKEGLDSLRKEVMRAEGYTKSAKMKFDDQCQISRDLHGQFKSADDLRQEAYTRLRNLKNESFEKNKCFYVYKDDAKIAANYQFAGNREALQSHCSNQVEKVMKLWNENAEFRNQYVEANMMSTVRRFRTLDGRSLGPDEEPLVLWRTTEEKVSHSPQPSSKINTALPVSASEREQEKRDAPVTTKKTDLQHFVEVSAKNQLEKTNLKHGMKVAPKNLSDKSKNSTKPTSKEAVLALVPSAEDEKEEREENRRTKEEEEQARKGEELARKEEQLKKEKAAAELKEQLRLEQIAKAKEAEERKRRKAEKAQAKAEIKAQKEAELREKKRAKKEKKRSVTTVSENLSGKAEAIPVSSDVSPPETVEEPEDKATVASRKPSRPSAAAKQLNNKIKPLPLSIRNRSKRKMQTWMWVLLGALIVLSFYLAGNYYFVSKFSLPKYRS